MRGGKIIPSIRSEEVKVIKYKEFDVIQVLFKTSSFFQRFD